MENAVAFSRCNRFGANELSEAGDSGPGSPHKSAGEKQVLHFFCNRIKIIISFVKLNRICLGSTGNRRLEVGRRKVEMQWGPAYWLSDTWYWLMSDISAAQTVHSKQ